MTSLIVSCLVPIYRFTASLSLLSECAANYSALTAGSRRVPLAILFAHYRQKLKTIFQGLEVSPPFTGPRFPPVVALVPLSHGFKGTLLKTMAEPRAGLSTSGPTFIGLQLVVYPAPPRGGLQVVPYCPRLRPWAGLMALCCKPAGGGLRLALGLALCSGGTTDGLCNEFSHVN